MIHIQRRYGMFYDTNVQWSGDDLVSALVTLTPSESKRLIAKAVAKLPEVTKALQDGLVIISRGSTNAFIAEEIMGISINAKAEEYCRGLITGGELRANRKTAAERTIGNDFVLRCGKVEDIQPQEAIKEFTCDDVFIKGANAIDSSGEAAVLVAGIDGGTTGWALPPVASRGSHLIVPVGLEKLVPSIALASPKCGVLRFKYSMGLPRGLFPLINAKIVTEIQALAILANVGAVHAASGGIGGSEGAVILAMEGGEKDLDLAFGIVKAIKQEPPVAHPENITPAAATFDYDPVALRNTLIR
jgi:hypothetical protein